MALPTSLYKSEPTLRWRSHDLRHRFRYNNVDTLSDDPATIHYVPTWLWSRTNWILSTPNWRRLSRTLNPHYLQSETPTFAFEASNLARTQITTQSGTSMLAKPTKSHRTYCHYWNRIRVVFQKYRSPKETSSSIHPFTKEANGIGRSAIG